MRSSINYRWRFIPRKIKKWNYCFDIFSYVPYCRRWVRLTYSSYVSVNLFLSYDLPPTQHIQLTGALNQFREPFGIVHILRHALKRRIWICTNNVKMGTKKWLILFADEPFQKKWPVIKIQIQWFGSRKRKGKKSKILMLV